MLPSQPRTRLRGVLQCPRGYMWAWYLHSVPYVMSAFVSLPARERGARRAKSE